MPSRRGKILLVVVGALVLIGLIVAALATNQEKLIPVIVEKVGKGRIVAVVTASGKVEAKTTVNISADVMGRIVSLPVVEGQHVEKGQLLVEIDKTQALSLVQQARAQLAAAKLDERHARVELERVEQLFSRNLVSKAEFDLAKIAYERAVEAVNQATANLNRATDELQKCTIRAPISGTITKLNSKVGENVIIGTMNNPGTVIMVISDLAEMVVKADVDETDIAQLAVGQEAKISLDAFPDTVFHGVVTEIGNAAKTTAIGLQDQVTNFEVTILFTDKAPGIRPGMNASVDITTSVRDDVVKVPIQAVVVRSSADTSNSKSNNKNRIEASDQSAGSEMAKRRPAIAEDEIDGVFVLDKKEVRFVPVKTGISDQQYIEIVSGLQPGQTVVTGTYKTLRTLRHGDRVKPKEHQPEESRKT